MKSGGNITSAAEMKAALDSENGVTGCQVAHVEVGNSDDIIISQKRREELPKSQMFNLTTIIQ